MNPLFTINGDYMKISEARVQDTRQISLLSRELTVSSESGKCGFVDFPTIEEDGFRRRVKNNSFFLVTREGREVAGFLASSSWSFFARKGLHDSIGLSQACLKGKENAVYVEQLGVAPEYRRQGYAREMLDWLILTTARQRITVLGGPICLHPTRNAGAISLFEDLGFVCEREVRKRGLTFGVYWLNT